MSLRRKDGNRDKLLINKCRPFVTPTPSNRGAQGERIILKSITKIKVSSEMMLEPWNIRIEKINLGHDVQKLNLKWIVRLNIKSETIQLLKENRGEFFFAAFG